MNVLLTCAGRRSYLVRYFREALGSHGRVFAGDMSSSAPSLAEADAGFRLLPVDDQGYIDHLLSLCAAEEVDLLVPLNDLELPLLAENRERFRETGVIPVVSAPGVVGICSDKWRSVEFLRANGLRAPKTFLSLTESLAAIEAEHLSFPLVVKPRWGSASQAMWLCHDDDDLRLMYARTRDMELARHTRSEADRRDRVIIQEHLPGLEHGLDVVNDLSGRYAATFGRRKLLMRAGETDQAVTVVDDRLEWVGRRLGETLGHVGNLDCDVFMDEDRITVIDMNARFGGGYPFSHAAGANLPAALIAWATGEQPAPSWLRPQPNVASSKYDEVVVVEPIPANPVLIGVGRSEAGLGEPVGDPHGTQTHTRLT